VIVALDVDYGVVSTTTALVAFRAWSDAASAAELVEHTTAPPAAYEPGRFFQRELPYLLAILDRFTDPDPTDAIVVDGYVDLGPDRAGLGRHLFAARNLPVVGVAKTHFAGAIAVEVTRGTSARPLYITAVGIEVAVAAAGIAAMHGPYRIPTLLKRADTLARGR